PEKSVDLIFADPPYNLQLQHELWRPNRTLVDAVNDEWDHFEDFAAYDQFSSGWLTACRRVLKDNGCIWVIGSYHNIFRIGKIMQDLGFWILNDVIWIKTNPMPNFRGVRFTNAHETLIWASKFKGARYTFNHHAMKALNDDKQMRSDWEIPICMGSERIRVDGKRAHSTQKPQALLYRIILATSKPGDVVLDPFLGSGTTAVVAKLLQRNWIGIEKEESYIQIAQERINKLTVWEYQAELFNIEDSKRTAPRVEFSTLVEQGWINPGTKLYFQRDLQQCASIRADGKLLLKDGYIGSIHESGRHLLQGKPCNGWQMWFYQDEAGEWKPIDTLREAYRKAGVRDR
ncbi:MAG: site-specific DNA-methyltransferase, partial [Anaerolineales bacterium]